MLEHYAEEYGCVLGETDVEIATERPLIEFRGQYYGKRHSAPMAVLVQFDGVLLHVWHMSEPFHRLLTSDVFRLPSTLGKRIGCIKLPNGCRIETEDLRALGTLNSTGASAHQPHQVGKRSAKWLATSGIIALLSAIYLISCWLLRS